MRPARGDWGNIDRFEGEDGVYELEGDWRRVRVISEPRELRDRYPLSP